MRPASSRPVQSIAEQQVGVSAGEKELSTMASAPAQRRFIHKDRFGYVFGSLKTQSYHDPAARGPGSHTFVKHLTPSWKNIKIILLILKFPHDAESVPSPGIPLANLSPPAPQIARCASGILNVRMRNIRPSCAAIPQGSRRSCSIRFAIRSLPVARVMARFVSGMCGPRLVSADWTSAERLSPWLGRRTGVFCLWGGRWAS
jgi:hypothetical protein